MRSFNLIMENNQNIEINMLKQQVDIFGKGFT